MVAFSAVVGTVKSAVLPPSQERVKISGSFGNAR
jgi:hypothetical protein